jgi:hypothetical protein
MMRGGRHSSNSRGKTFLGTRGGESIFSFVIELVFNLVEAHIVECIYYF